MDDLDLDAKTDRELLLMAVQRLNTACEDVKSLKKWRDGNGLPGAKFQIAVMWAVFIFFAIKIFQ